MHAIFAATSTLCFMARLPFCCGPQHTRNGYSGKILSTAAVALAATAVVTAAAHAADSTTTVSVGTLAGQVLTWAVTAFGGVITTVGTFWILRLAKKAGIEGADLMSKQLNETLLNGLNDGAARIAAGVQGQGTVQIKNQVIQSAIEYAQAHRAETIQALGLDPSSGKTVEALRARIATLVNDPSSPTPPVLGGPGAPPAIP